MSDIAGSYHGSDRMAEDMTVVESPVVFDCQGDRLIGIIARPRGQTLGTGVLILVGGPQYRAGSHRQFTLLARAMANSGIASLRFDYRGMGDSEGNPRTFEMIDIDIAAAVDCLMRGVERLRAVIIWGLCDAASAALMYGHLDRRVTGLVLLNPWVHTKESAFEARLKNYYSKRLLASSFWLKLISGQFRFRQSAADVFASVRSTMKLTRCSDEDLNQGKITADSVGAAVFNQNHSATRYFISRMLEGLRQFKGATLFVLSGQDLAAIEFALLIEHNRHWRTASSSQHVRIERVDEANHTFSSRELREAASHLTINFVLNQA